MPKSGQYGPPSAETRNRHPGSDFGLPNWQNPNLARRPSNITTWSRSVLFTGRQPATWTGIGRWLPGGGRSEWPEVLEGCMARWNSTK